MILARPIPPSDWMTGVLASCQTVDFHLPARQEETACWRWITPAFLREPLLVPDLLAPFEARFDEGTDRRAMASRWSHLYGCITLPSLLTALALCDWQGDLRLASPVLRLALAEDASPRRLLFLSATPSPRRSLAARWQELMVDHFAPLHQGLAEWSGVSPRVLWGNVAALVCWSLDELHRQHKRRVAAAVDAARAVMLASPTLYDGSANPVHGCLRLRPDGSQQRKVCCLSYLLPDETLCPSCPLPPSRL